MSDSIYRVYRLVTRRQEGEVGATLILDGALAAEPGQFFMVWLPGIEERPLAVMGTDPLSLTVREVGLFTRAITALNPGDCVWVRGPYGHGFPLVDGSMLLVGGGSGIASLTLLAQRGVQAGNHVHVVLGARTAGQLMLGWRFEELGVPVTIATDDGSAGVKGNVVDALEPLILADRPGAIFACGPEPMLLALWRRLQDSAIPLYVSLERAMKCGFGVCGNCHCGDRLVCRDGPVFAAAEVMPVLQGDGR